MASRLLQSYEGQVWTYASKTAYVATVYRYVAFRPAQRQRAAIRDSLTGPFLFGNTSFDVVPDMLYLLICDVCCQLKLQQRQRLKGEEGAHKSITARVANVTLQDMLRLQSTCAARCNGTQAFTCPVYCQQLDNAAGIHSSIYAHMLFWTVRYIQCRVAPCLRGSRGATWTDAQPDQSGIFWTELKGFAQQSAGVADNATDLHVDWRIAGTTAVAGWQHILTICERATPQLHACQLHRLLHATPHSCITLTF